MAATAADDAAELHMWRQAAYLHFISRVQHVKSSKIGSFWLPVFKRRVSFIKIRSEVSTESVLVKQHLYSRRPHARQQQQMNIFSYMIISEFFYAGNISYEFKNTVYVPEILRNFFLPLSFVVSLVSFIGWCQVELWYIGLYCVVGRRRFLKMKRCNWTSGKRWSTSLILRSAIVLYHICF